MANIFMTLKGITVQIGGGKLLDGLDWTIRRGQQWAVTGESGSGKTVLAHTLMGRHFYTGQMDEPDETEGGGPRKSRIAMVEQQHKFRSQAGTTELYYQQRFNASDADKTITVAQELAEYAGWEGNGASAVNEGQPKERESWLDSLHIRPLLNKPLDPTVERRE
jgi:molybdate transport system ATP-binding protein